MDLNEYQKATAKTLKPECNNKEYLTLGLNGEAGEVADKIKKIIRGDGLLDTGLLYEIGDVLWYVARLSALFRVDLDYIATLNLEKLEQRLSQGTISGSGDKR
ncbi:MAG: nucleoside triphosphate pyrophosphohydrolase family protein [Candidatus Muiribacteriota bacterium]